MDCYAFERYVEMKRTGDSLGNAMEVLGYSAAFKTLIWKEKRYGSILQMITDIWFNPKGKQIGFEFEAWKDCIKMRIRVEAWHYTLLCIVFQVCSVLWTFYLN